MTDRRLPGARLALMAVALLALGFLAGYLATRTGGPEMADPGTAEEGNLYTCGMHPNVIQQGPGICPICNMELTPLRSTAAASSGGERRIKYWVAPMDPNYISDRPGKSPMGMDLIPVYEDAVESARAVMIDPAVVQNIGVRTARVERGPLTKTVRATGEVVEDETRVGIVNLKVAGWVETVHVDETGQQVERGDPLLEIYSPQLVTTQEEYLIALNHLRRVEASGSPAVVEAAERTLESTRRRLRYWDITEGQIAELERTGEVRKTMVLRSPFRGVVTMKGVLPGQKVLPGTDLYHIADLSHVWVETSVPEADAPYVSVGEKGVMSLASLPGRTLTGRVTFISPVVDRETRDLKVRLEFANPEGLLRPGMYAAVVLESRLADQAVLVPHEAVIRTGKNDVVFIAQGEGRFLPAEVKLGLETEGNRVEILAGVRPGELVVTSAQFLLDSESAFQEALRKMVSSAAPAEGPIAPAAQHVHEHRAAPEVEASLDGVPVANAISLEPDGAVRILCPVMKGERTVAPGDEVYTEYEGMRIYYCCPGCQSRFEEDPERYLAELDEFLRRRAEP